MIAFLIAVLLVAYNNLMNRWTAFAQGWYVPANSIFAGALAGLAFGPLGLGREEVGFWGDWRAALLGAGLGLVLAAPFFLALSTARGARAIADRRLAGLTRAGLVYRMLLRVPVGTAFLEEFAFRGVLFAAARPSGDFTAAIISSVAFGLWHIAPTQNLVRANRKALAAIDGSSVSDKAAEIRAISISVAFAALAGLFLVWLRVRTTGIAAPFALHAFLNSFTTMASALAARRLVEPAARRHEF